MAKSKKALKALKRRKEAKKRSRALKERQDYTGGGRVKAFNGLGNFNIPIDEDAEMPNELFADLSLYFKDVDTLDSHQIDMSIRGDG